MQQDGLIRLTDPASEATLKTISFFNAYCTQMDLTFRPGISGGTGSIISPQRVAVGAITHDNNWPVPSHGAGQTFVSQQQSKPKVEPITINQPIPASIPPIQEKVKAAAKPGAIAMASVTSTCPESIRAALQRDVTRYCKGGDLAACKGNDSCPTLAIKTEAQRACMNARWLIMVKCYKGGDASHKEQLQNRINGLGICEALFSKKCGPNSTQKPVPEPSPVPPISTIDPDFIEKMEKLTGLTGAALIIYLIISEGTRLFPPRNLIPLP